MKRYFIYIVMVVAVLFVGCTTDVTDSPEMTEVGNIKVSFSVEGREVSRLDLLSISHNIVVDVTLNNEGVYWTPTSNQEWCQIVEEEHRGSGSFTMIINANESFDARESATVTFTAGGYSAPMLTVNHNGNVFIIDKVYAASTKDAGSRTISVQTIEGVEWDTDCDSWVTATKGVSTTADGVTTTELTISWEANSDVSRYGEVRFVKDGEEQAEGWFNIWQYGSEVTYDEEGYILLEAQNATPIELRVPKQTIKDIVSANANVLPSWVTYTTEENSDDTISYMLTFGDNPSDAKHIRSTNLALSLLSGAADIALPVIKQEYYDMEGLLTGPGLQLFAKTWNEGGDISQWCIDGVPTLVENVDMTEVVEWTSIGTEARPWSGVFNGNGKKLLNLTASQPIFGYCKDAEIKDLSFDTSVLFELLGNYGQSLYLAPLAGVLENSTISNCTNNASVVLDASTSTAQSESYVAGLVGKVDKTSKISYCTNIGTVDVKSSSTTVVGQSKFYVGGLVAHNAGTIEDSFNNGAVSSSALVNTTYLGGVAGYTSTSSILRGNLNAGALTFGTARGSNQGIYGYVGGITGRANGEFRSNSNDGDITSTSAVQNLYLGGITGCIADYQIVLADNTQGNSSDLKASGKATYSYVGGIAGYVEDIVELTMDFTSSAGSIGGTVTVDGFEYGSNTNISMGGYFGYCGGKTTLTAPKWTGTATFSMAQEAFTIKEINVGGLIGCADSALTITGAETNGDILTVVTNPATVAANNQIKITTSSMGGLVGKSNGAVKITGSTNNANIKWNRTNNRQNGNACFVGGIIGRIGNVEAEITDCHNKNKIHGQGYNNNSYSTGLTMNAAGGIVGAYGVTSGATNSLKLKDCTNTASINAIRGFVAGIAGFVSNGTVENCTYLNGRITDDQNCHMAGIVGGTINSTVYNCTATAELTGYYGGSCAMRAGGIVAWAMNSATIEKCKYFGNINVTSWNPTAGSEEYAGGIVGYSQGEEDVVIKDCQFGGSVAGVEISSNNFSNYIVGTASQSKEPCIATISGVTYWNGK